MRIDVSLVEQEKLREAILDTLENEGYEFEQVDFWESITRNDLSSLHKNIIVAAGLKPLTKLLINESFTNWSRYIRSQAPFFLVYLKNLEDQKRSSFITEILETVSGRMKVVSLWDMHINVQKKTLGEWVAKIAQILDPSILLEIRISKKDKSIWLQFGDGFARTISWQDLPFSRRRPRLILESAVIVDGGWTLAFGDTSGQVFEVSSEALRMLVSPGLKKEIEKEDQKARKSMGEKLREWRKTNQLSQVELSERSGLAQAAISRIEGGYHHPRLDTLQKYASALDLDVPALLQGPE